MKTKLLYMIRVVCLLFFGIIISAIKAPEVDIESPKTWEETILQFQKSIKDHKEIFTFIPYQSPVLRIRDKTLKISIDISDMEYLKLAVGGSIDGNTKDHAAWGNATFVNKNGKAIHPNELEVLKEKQGWSKLTYDKNLVGGEIILNNKPFEHGIVMHADGYAIFKLGGKYTTFESEIGIEQINGDRSSSVVFKVMDYLPDMLMDQLEVDYPLETKLFKKYAGASDIDLFTENSLGIVRYVAGRLQKDKGINNLVEQVNSSSAEEKLSKLKDMLHIWIALEKLERVNPEATIEAYNFLSQKFGAQYLTRVEKGSEAKLESLVEDWPRLMNQLKSGDLQAIDGANQVAHLARTVLLSNPLLIGKSIFSIRHKINGDARTVMANGLGYPENNWTTSASINSANSGWNNELIALTDPLDPKIKGIHKPAGDVLINDPDIHWDGKRILFSSVAENGRWNLFEIKADGSGLKQLTPEGYDDIDFFDGCYLPNGKIAMVSNAPYQGVPCVGGNEPTGSMYLLDPNTKNIRQLNFGQDNDWNPVVLNNGRIMYLRWEYTDAAHYFTRILMHMNPDGTGKKEYYGSSSYWPNSVFESRPIPGNSSLFTGIVSGHHGIARSGKLVVFDPKRGRKEADGVIQEIPFKDRKVKPIIKDKLVDGVWPQFLSSYPLDENFFLATAKPNPGSLWGIYLVDAFDNMTLILENEGEAFLYPMLLEKREMPPVIPDKVNLRDSTSTVYIANIYEGPGLKGVPKGSVDQLRLFAYHFGYNKSGGHDALGIQSGWDVKRVLGTVPVENDGSAMFKIPANTPISLQPLDKNGRAMQLMRSWFTGMPGEVVSCVGCHENQNTIPPARPTIASRKLPDTIKPFYGDVRPFTFANEVQPILDRKCTSCHDGSNDLPNFSDKTTSGYRNLSGAYKALHPYVRRPGPESDVHVLTPMDFHAGTSELIQKLENGHHDVILTKEEWDRLHTWIDLNVPYHGQFDAPEYCENNQTTRRQELALEFGGYPIDIEKEMEVAEYLKSIQDTSPESPQKKDKKAVKHIEPSSWRFSKTEAKEKQTSLGKIHKTIQVADGLVLKIVKIPAGKFECTNHEGDNYVERIEKPFWIGQFEITNAQFTHFFPDHDSRFVAQFWKDHTSRGYPVNSPHQPVVRVSWEESLQFCEKLSNATGMKFSLPNAAQWEWACRAGSADAFWFGNLDDDFSSFENLADESLSDFAVIGVNPKPMDKDNARFPYYNFIPQAPYNDGELISAAAGKYKPNPWDLYDMHGNVSEWVLNDYDSNQTENLDLTSERKMIKGGSWRDRPCRSTASSSLGYYPWQKIENVGFRVMMEE